MTTPYVEELRATAKAMVAPGKGLLAMDESNDTCNRRFVKVGIPTTVEMRQAYRQLILTAPGLGDAISGAILYDETIRQSSTDGVPMVQLAQQAGIIPGIKVDAGAKDMALFPGEKVTEGLDRLRERIREYYEMGARFAKWRAVIAIGEGIPTHACLEANAHGLARYAALCQEGGLVPIVEPEVLIDGNHTIERCYSVTRETLDLVFTQLYEQRVAFDQMILKPSMVISGSECPRQAGVEEVAKATVDCLRNAVPASVAGIAFLSGGQTEIQASQHLNAMHVHYQALCPWPVTFSYARAIQQPALEHWAGQPERVAQAQKLLVHRAKANSAASLGTYTPAFERA